MKLDISQEVWNQFCERSGRANNKNQEILHPFSTILKKESPVLFSAICNVASVYKDDIMKRLTNKGLTEDDLTGSIFCAIVTILMGLEAELEVNDLEKLYKPSEVGA